MTLLGLGGEQSASSARVVKMSASDDWQAMACGESGDYADLAQLVEHLSCKQKVRGSNPLVGSVRPGGFR